VFVLAAWCGLAGGLMEVATRLVCKNLGISTQLFQMSRHFLWLAPLSNLLLFSGMGSILALAIKLWPRRAGWLSPRLICACALLPGLVVACPRVYSAALLVLAFGIASCLIDLLEPRVGGLRRWWAVSFLGLVGLVTALAAFAFVPDWLKQRVEAGRPMPRAGSPNVLLIVLDTVRADHLSLYGYHRGTTPTLERLAKGGIRFDEARASAPWTLPSHATMFTGRWPHEVHARWMAPLRGKSATLAGFLGSRGYATAGFVANTLYCSYDTGLDRGFTHYEDYVFDLEPLGPFRTALLADRVVKAGSDLALALSRSFDAGPFRPWQQAILGRLLASPRKNAERINRDFLGWLSGRPNRERPFFVFLNYLDAHAPYLPPAGTSRRFGSIPQTPRDFSVLVEQWASLDQSRLPERYRAMARDCYDNCLAYLDECLGHLFRELERRGELDRTLVIVTADHGEEFGDHDLFDHGESLYRPEVRVPLLIVPPLGRRQQAVVTRAVSLRDLPATVVEMVGLEAGSPFPGESLARTWRPEAANLPSASVLDDGVLSELESPNPANPSRGRSPASRGPLVSLAEGDFVYIRNEADGTEELFNDRDDPGERRNRARDAAAGPILKRFRERLAELATRSAPPAG
jgi:arylsulfatase A-like enzyme